MNRSGEPIALHCGFASYYVTFVGVAMLTTSPLLGEEVVVRPTPTFEQFTEKQVKEQLAPATAQLSAQEGVTPELAAVWQFLASRADSYKLPPDLSNLALIDTRKSLLGTHFHFQQLLSGVDVDQATIVVSTDSKGRITSVFNGTIPATADKVVRATNATVGRDKAIEIAWNALGAQVDPNKGMYSEPAANLRYLPDKSSFRLVYAVELHVVRKRVDGQDQSGLWQVNVDANTGEVVGEPIKLSLNHKQQEADEFEKRAGDLTQALGIMRAAKQAKAAAASAAPSQKAAGSGSVFDPDPTTTLQNPALRDADPPASFGPAYQTVGLPDITTRGGLFHLEGPWVRIDDFESPTASPSTTNNGQWSARRGDNAFNDVMTYFHIDRSQRYIQSLGFTNIQAAPIPADSNGLSGDDNSHYLPGINRIAFGHGCIDDNEDADVILHEYGHAITYGINPQWGGGDSGAIGEGFGDYWAETSSYASPHGSTYNPFTVFDWDASDGCWPGRRLNITPAAAQYDPARTYGAHQGIGGGVQSDELWATPLYQAHVELRQAGVPREEIDKIVLQSMFGLGAGFSMRDLAESVVQTARTLYPTGPHATVFEHHFQSFNILP